MTDEREPSLLPIPRASEPESGPAEGEARDASGRAGFPDQDPSGTPRGPRRSRYGRRRAPGDGPGPGAEGGGGGYQGERPPQQQPDRGPQGERVQQADRGQQGERGYHG